MTTALALHSIKGSVHLLHPLWLVKHYHVPIFCFGYFFFWNSQHKMIDPFQKLPEEIIIQILESCWDFTSLDGLLQISLKANEVFDTYYPRITEAVVASCSMTSGFNDHKFRLVVAIQAAAIGPRTLRKCLEDKHWEPMPPVMESIFWSLECSTPIRQAINSAAKVHRLACICYDSFIENVKKAKPARPNVSENEIMTGFAPIHQCD